jgi:hypothetical protein
MKKRDKPAPADAATQARQRSGKSDLSPAARRALAEAEARRGKREEEAGKQPKEIGGRDGPDPVRYGDWEKDGIISDF